MGGLITSVTNDFIVNKYRELKPGGHYFSPETMEFWQSKIHSTCLEVGGRWFFITSEKTGFSSDKRAYSVRCMHADGNITTVGEFLAHKTLHRAEKALEGVVEAIKLDGRLLQGDQI